MIEFEIADIDFAEALVQFWKKSFLAAYSDIHSEENIQAYFSISYTIEEATRILTCKNYECLKAKRDQQTVGISIVNNRRCPLKAELDAMELKHLYLLPSEYGSRLAHRIMDEVFDQLKDAGKTHIWLSVSKLNQRAQRFYKKLGFEMLGKGEDIHVGDEVLPSLVLMKKLN
ncbi:GNAT family N-acetyltransferase [Ekhidna sp. To15]|uniref:GNAT family N-acetyltransferase n=1 Tax=Ekhidna sp. To15 TaxID=3395267 RepID=UPI003F520EDB